MQNKKEYWQKYYSENKYDILQQKKEYYILNSDELKKRKKEYYYKNKEKCLKKSREYQNKNRKQITDYNKKYYKERDKPLSKQIMKELKINGCSICGYSKCVNALDFHHTNPTDKIFNMTANSIIKKSNEQITEELNKCILICSNCHREITWSDSL